MLAPPASGALVAYGRPGLLGVVALVAVERPASPSRTGKSAATRETTRAPGLMDYRPVPLLYERPL
jgi:hypothetical protein